MKFSKCVSVALVGTMLTGCSSLNNLSNADIGTAMGGAGGVVIGSMFGNGLGSVAAVAVGGAVGALAGRAVGSEYDNKPSQSQYNQ